MRLSLERYLLPYINGLHRFCNVLLIVLALLALGVTIWAEVQIRSKLGLVFRYETLSFIVFQASMFVVLLIAIESILSSRKSSSCRLLVNILSVLFLILVVASYAIWKGVKTDYTKQGELYFQLESDIYLYNKQKAFVDFLQSALSCCGVDNYSDWGDNNTIPASCFNYDVACPEKRCLHLNGCFKNFHAFHKYLARYVLIGVVFLTLIQIITATLSFLLYRSLVITRRIKELGERNARITIPRITSISPVPPAVAEINETNEEKEGAAKEEETQKEKKPEMISLPKDVEIQKNGRNWFVFNFYGNSAN